MMTLKKTELDICKNIDILACVCRENVDFNGQMLSDAAGPEGWRVSLLTDLHQASGLCSRGQVFPYVQLIISILFKRKTNIGTYN